MLTDSPLAKLKTVSVDELLSEPLIVMRSGYLMHRYLHRILDGRTPRVSYSTDGGEMGKLMVAVDRPLGSKRGPAQLRSWDGCPYAAAREMNSSRRSRAARGCRLERRRRMARRTSVRSSRSGRHVISPRRARGSPVTLKSGSTVAPSP